MHTGGEATLEDVINFYDRGGNANEFLDTKMRDFGAEMAISRGHAAGAGVARFGPARKPVVPLKLNLTPEEKADLVLFVRGIQGAPVDPTVADPARFPAVPGRPSR